MIAADVMSTNPKTLEPSATLSEAIHLLRDEQVRHLPITHDGAVVGMLSDRDVRELSLGAVLADDVVAFHARMDQPIGSIANTEVVTVTPEASLRRIVELLLERRLGAIPVVEADGVKLVGMVSTVDVMRALLDHV